MQTDEEQSEDEQPQIGLHSTLVQCRRKRILGVYVVGLMFTFHPGSMQTNSRTCFLNSLYSVYIPPWFNADWKYT